MVMKEMSSETVKKRKRKKRLEVVLRGFCDCTFDRIRDVRFGLQQDGRRFRMSSGGRGKGNRAGRGVEREKEEKSREERREHDREQHNRKTRARKKGEEKKKEQLLHMIESSLKHVTDSERDKRSSCYQSTLEDVILFQRESQETFRLAGRSERRMFQEDATKRRV